MFNSFLCLFGIDAELQIVTTLSLGFTKLKRQMQKHLVHSGKDH